MLRLPYIRPHHKMACLSEFVNRRVSFAAQIYLSFGRNFHLVLYIHINIMHRRYCTVLVCQTWSSKTMKRMYPSVTLTKAPIACCTRNRSSRPWDCCFSWKISNELRCGADLTANRDLFVLLWTRKTRSAFIHS
jgi:hypothetical protein